MRLKLFILILLLLPVSSLWAEDPASRGESVFRAHCVKCHGEGAAGTKAGPPLVHRFYNPDHHADITFRWAVERGVRAHHWSFGDMPKIEGVSKDEVDSVIVYIRGLQKKAGIF